MATSRYSKTGSASRKSRYDLTTSEGLSRLAESRGGAVAEKAMEITGEKKSVFSKIGGGLKKGLGKVLDIAQRPNFAIAGGVKNVIDTDPTTTFDQGFESGWTGESKHTFSDVFEEAGWNPTDRGGKIVKGVAGFATDILLDPTTYISFGASAGVKVATKAGARTLTREGAELLAKGVARKALTEAETKALEKGLAKGATAAERKIYESAVAKQAEEAAVKLNPEALFGENFVKNAIARMAESSPELYKKFIDQGGVKFFGNTIISAGRIAAVSRAIPGMTKLDEATLPIRNALGALWSRDISAAYGKLPQELIDLLNRYRDLGSVKTQEAIQRGADIARANNLTVDEAYIITDAIEAGLAIGDARLDHVRKLFQESMGRNFREESMRGITNEQRRNYVAHMLLEKPVKNVNFRPEGVRVSAPFAEGRKYEGSMKKIFEETGIEFDPNIVNTATIRDVLSQKAILAHDFLRDVGAKFGAVAKEAPSNYIESGAKELAGRKFHPLIVEQIDKFKKGFVSDEATNNLLRAFDKAQGLWKASVTSVFPAFHGRNAISNVFLNFLDLGAAALSPAKNLLSVSLLRKNNKFQSLERAAFGLGDEAAAAKGELEKLSQEVILTDDFGKKWTFGELRTVIKDNRVAFGDEFTGFVDVRENIAEKIGGATTARGTAQKLNPFSQQNIAFQTGRRIGNLIEQQARVLNFITNLGKTGDVMTSAKRTKQFIFDYTNLSEFEKNVMRRLVPFYTFTRKNLELQVTQLARQPGKLATQAKLFTSISKAVSGATITDKERLNLPEFLQEGLGMVVSRDKNNVEIINSIGSPIEQIFTNLDPDNLFGSLSPVIAVPMQVAIGKHFFYDTDLKDVNKADAYQHAPQFLKDYIGYTTRKNKDGSTRHIALNPTRMFLINNIPPLSRGITTIGHLEEENVSGKLKIIRQLTGLKPYGADLDRQEAINEKNKIRELQDLLDEAGVAPIFRRSFIPK